MGAFSIRQGDQAPLIDGQEVTATAAELNAASGSGISAAELGVLNGVVAGTAADGKAVVLGTGKTIDTIDIATPKIGGTAVTASAAEVNKLAGSGAVVASGTQAANIPAPSGGATQDAEARTAITSIIAALEAFGISAAS